jgi:hypothetical protein
VELSLENLRVYQDFSMRRTRRRPTECALPGAVDRAAPIHPDETLRYCHPGENHHAKNNGSQLGRFPLSFIFFRLAAAENGGTALSRGRPE